ncbi:Superkiller viralicidic activity 2-like 2 [Galdieria sulphuraria]|uniref:ATP-dependent RNA helicase n=1 Tax=Galdieria sulphuraria TaxID=130081 RepID=M2XXG7_GALSU|nr:ATP-dependent RNA helicase [Galdieria sulphuraria]EME28318.1 ATP-dependent RNA helicase [Galdieria sulphuraria]GJD12505.1 Superkiller viralicidic activity 2-like 2 [Galdieria sulphuraria]|eukprot:XP_005704838.1 ATP-dependent RNA helicase [Galdieria sulphuraria]
MSDDLFDVFDATKAKRPQDAILEAMETAETLEELDDDEDVTEDQAIEPPEKWRKLELTINEERRKNSDTQIVDNFRENKKKPRSFHLQEYCSDSVNETCTTDSDLKTSCIHDVSLPAEYGEYLFEPKETSRKPAKEYKFTLDAFQRESIRCLERNESVLVSAHTSAGKTAIAEYAVAMSLRDGQRVIYTSPIKALSNQKYRELYEEFIDVGLMTGDVTINPSAGCLVMTTEILRSMLYRGSEVIREVAWVIFDEVHYMRDKERGVVWEETIIMVPENVRFVFLSATIPNAREFAEWIVQLKNQPCHTIYTDSRPVPLQHYLFPAGGDGLYLVVDEKGQFRDDTFEKALSKIGENSIKDTSKGAEMNKKNKKAAKGASDVYRIIKLIMEREYDPVIVFAFSRRECEALALQLSKLELNTDEQKSLVEQVFVNAMDSLSEDDKKLPQITAALPLLKRGIGIHHSGLLPILKEVTEILFQEGLIKVLFATETFAMGLNMPAKTVVFTAVRKFDGEAFRFISGGEYIQMSGRAGRRGLDERGISILTVDERIQPETARAILKGNADPLRSSFHLEYNMLLNLLRSEEANPEYVISRSLAQFQADRALPDNEAKLNELLRQKDELKISMEDDVKEFAAYKDQLERLRSKVRNIVFQAKNVLPFLQVGRLARFCVQDKEVRDFGWGVVVNFTKMNTSQVKEQGLRDKFLIDALVFSKPLTETNEKVFVPPKGEEDIAQASWNVLPFHLSALDGLSSIRVYMPKDLRPRENRSAVGKSVSEVMRQFPKGIPLLDPVEDMGIKDEEFRKLIRQAESVEDQLFSSKLAQKYSLSLHTTYPEELSRLMDSYQRKEQILVEIKAVKRQIRLGQGLILREELKRMLRVLRRLGFINHENIVEKKGRTACEVNTADELVLTELMFHGAFNEIKAEVAVALLSCFVYDEKQDEQLQFSDEELKAAFQTLQNIARRVGTVTKECKIPIDVDEYVQSFDPSMMNVVYAWCRGAIFAEICKMTHIFEGSIIRCMRRLEELLRQLSAAAHSIGNEELEHLFEKGSQLLKRDIAFQASLYL